MHLSYVESVAAQLQLPPSTYVCRRFGTAQVEFDRGYLYFSCGSDRREGEVHGAVANRLFEHLSTIPAAAVDGYLCGIDAGLDGDCTDGALNALRGSVRNGVLAQAA